VNPECTSSSDIRTLAHCAERDQDAADFTCPECKMTSHNPDDVANGYCGNCHTFHAAGREDALTRTVRRLHTELSDLASILWEEYERTDGNRARAKAQGLDELAGDLLAVTEVTEEP
jgi:hypothetical protein